MWDTNNYEIKALVKYEGNIVQTIPLTFEGPSTFQGKIEVSNKGIYEVIVYVYDEQTGNTGVDKVAVEVN